MSDTLKELLKALDVSEELAEKPVNEIQEAIHSKWINRTMVETDPEIKTKFAGKLFGGIQTLALREFGLEAAEVKDKKAEDYITIGAGKLKAKIAELEEAVKGGDGAEWQKKIEKIQKDADRYKGMAETLQQEKEKLDAEWSGKLKKTSLDYAITGLKSKIPFADDFAADELKKKGFDSHINESFVFDFNEANELIVTTKKGEPIQNEKKTGFLSPEDVLKTELKKFNGLKIVAAPGAPKPKPEPPAPVKVQGQERKLPVNLQKRLGT